MLDRPTIVTHTTTDIYSNQRHLLLLRTGRRKQRRKNVTFRLSTSTSIMNDDLWCVFWGVAPVQLDPHTPQRHHSHSCVPLHNIFIFTPQIRATLFLHRLPRFGHSRSVASFVSSDSMDDYHGGVRRSHIFTSQ